MGTRCHEAEFGAEAREAPMREPVKSPCAAGEIGGCYGYSNLSGEGPMTSILALWWVLVPAQDPKEKDSNLDDLKNVVMSVLGPAKFEQTDMVRETLLAWKLSKEEFQKIFGDGKTVQAYEAYEIFWKRVDKEVAPDLVKRVKEKNFQAVDVWSLNGADPKTLSDYEKSLLVALVDKKMKVYNARMRSMKDREGKEGFVLVGFVKVGEEWRALLDGGKGLGGQKKDE
jgi:hypothetical protein